MMSGSYGKFPTVKQHMERLMDNMAEGAGDHLAMTIALDLGLCRWTIKPKTKAGLKKLQKDLEFLVERM